MAGYNYYCPCCGQKFRKFKRRLYRWEVLHFDTKRYKDIDQYVFCPYCGSLPRHRILVSFLSENPSLIMNKRILIFAAEKSVKKWFGNKQIRFFTADISRGVVDYRIDIMDTRLEDESFDLIICNHVLEHVLDFRKALKELHRIISPEGHIILSFPVDAHFETVHEDNNVNTRIGRIKAFGQHDHLRIFGRDTKELLEKCGFSVKEISGKKYDSQIKPVIGPADYDSNILYLLSKHSNFGQKA